MGQKHKGKRRKYITHLLRFMVAAGALYLAFRGEDIGVVLRLLGGMRIAILVSALGIYIFSQLIFVTRWYMFLRVQSI